MGWSEASRTPLGYHRTKRFQEVWQKFSKKIEAERK